MKHTFYNGHWEVVEAREMNPSLKYVLGQLVTFDRGYVVINAVEFGVEPQRIIMLTPLDKIPEEVRRFLNGSTVVLR